MASIRPRCRKDGSRFWAVLYRLDGKQTSSSFNDHTEAQRFQDVCDRLGPAEALKIWKSAAPKDGVTVGEFLGAHIEALSGVEKKTLAEYRRYLTRDIEPVLGPVPLSTLTRTDISRWVNKLRDDGASGKTIQNKTGFLSGCLNAAVREGLILANPATGIRLPRTIRREMCFLTRLEFDLLKAGFTERWHPLLDFLVASGARFSEATALTPADVDRVNATVRISKAWKRTPDGYELGQPKTRRSIRTVSLPTALLDRLNYDHEYLFTNSDLGPIRIYSFRSNVWYPSLAKATTKDDKNSDKPVLTKAARIHDLRHTNASWLLGAGVPLITVSAMLGHEDVATTARIYGHLDTSAGKAAAAAMGAILDW
ncbi:tyrosine-type recombinase/integrase [Mycobacterium colombiense]